MAVRTKTWTREEYERLVAAGGFAPDARVQLIQGEIIEMTLQGTAHATAIRKCRRALEAAFGATVLVDMQMPLTPVGSESVPEPDLSVLAGSHDAYRDAHPAVALLVVEIADSSLNFDQTRKQAVYAAGDIPEYWLLNLVDRTLEVYRDPAGESYRTKVVLQSAGRVTPLGAPRTSLDVASLLP